MRNILFLSNDPVLRRKNTEILTQSGLETIGVDGCLDGLLQLDKNEYSLVILDEELADTNGYEACIKIRQHSDVPIILLGSVSEQEVWAKVEELGFDLYLRKPISPRELYSRIQAILRRPFAEKKIREPVTIQRSFTDNPNKQQQNATPVSPQVLVNQPEQQSFSPAAPQSPIMQSEPHIAASPPQSVPVQTPLSSWSFQVPPQKVAAQGQPSPELSPPAVPSYTQQVVSREANPASSILPPVRQTVVTPETPPVYSVPPIQNFSPHERSPQTAPPSVNVRPQQEQPQSQAAIATSAVPLAKEADVNVMEDPRTIRLIEALVSEKLKEINPVVDLSSKLGYTYPEVESYVETSEAATVHILEVLSDNGILVKKPYDKFYMDPDGQFQLTPTERCPRCDSANLVRGQLVEHFACGYVSMDKDFKQDFRYVCPKCHKEMRLMGTDYRNIGIHYRCLDCTEVFLTPVVKWRNLKTRKVWNIEELKEITAFFYTFSPDKKGWLEFQLKPKAQLIDFLRQQGYQVQEFVQMAGSSGAKHMVDILATRDDILTKITLGIGILVAPADENEVNLETLFRYDTRAYDVGINYKVVIAIPRLGHEAVNFASRQMIGVFETKTLASIVSSLTNLPKAKVVLHSSTELAHAYDPHAGFTTIDNAKTTVVKFLMNRGYEVFEKALLTGKSGVEHIFEIYARRDDKIIAPTIAIAIAGSPAGQPIGIDDLTQFDSEAYDCMIRNKVFVAIPQLSDAAKQFARQQKIAIIEAQDLSRLI